MPSSAWSKIKRLLAAPVFDGDEDKTRAAAFLNVLLWAALATQFLSPIVYSGNIERGLLCVAAWTAMIVSALWLLHRGSVRTASITAIVVSWLLVNLLTGHRRWNSCPGFQRVFDCGWMRRDVAGLAVDGGHRSSQVIFPWHDRDAVGTKRSPPSSADVADVLEWVTYTMIFFVASLQLGLFITDIRNALDRVRKELAERKRTEQALAESEERYRNLVENAPEAILLLDVDTRKFVDANTNAEKMFGVTREELLNCGPGDFSPPTQPNGKVSTELGEMKNAEALETGYSYFEWLHRDKSGREIYTEIRLVRLPSKSGRLIRGTIIDVTARKRLEAHLLQAQKMESIGLLAGGVAHDFNNLLAVILSSTELMTLKPECAPAKPHIIDIRSAASRAAQLTRQLLAFSRKQILQPSVTDLNVVITETEKMLRRLIGAHIEMKMVLCARCVFGHGRSRADRTGSAQPGRQRARRDAQRRDADAGHSKHAEWKRFRRFRSGNCRTAASELAVGSLRHRLRHGRKYEGASLRAFLHHERSRSGNRPWAVDGARHH